MKFVLSSQNVVKYLIEYGLCTPQDEATTQVEVKYAKNFNLLLSLPNGHKLLVKQESRDQEGKIPGEFFREWRIHQFLEQFPELSQIRSWLSEGIHFNPKNFILVFNYLDNYHDLMDFYIRENLFPIEIATAVSKVLATIHRLTFDNLAYKEFFLQKYESQLPDIVPRMIQRLERLSPEIFGSVPADGLKFFALYQRYDILGKAIAELGNSLTPCCVTHNDLKLNNILLSNDWQDVATDSMVRLIDWERCGWGDPAFDLGTLVGSYLQLWLNSLVTSKAMNIDESLRMAATPLEQIQPSLTAIVNSYFAHFPEILQHRPSFLDQVVQFSGWSLINAIQARLQYQKSFGNTGICMLQVAKSLLCRPTSSMQTIFGMEASELTSKSLNLA